jgi:23S rRNA (guanine2445-N2)-methyltransferase / 23S rRNA (guanine2069-N7)-methyltransferase
MSQTFPIHVRTVTGLEEVLAEELSSLGAKAIEVKNRLVVCEGDTELLYKANIWCRTAIRVLLPLATFPATDEKSFYQGVKDIDWQKWMKSTGTLAVDANVHSSFNSHSLYISQLAKDAVVDQFREKTGKRPSVDLEKPDLRIAVSLFQDVAQIFVDSSGESLHKRGYRRKAGEAPLSETLAAGIIKLSGWKGEAPLLDPMCGSGTLGIEAGLILRNIAPGLLRKTFGFQNWPDYDSALYDRIMSDAKSAIRKEASAVIISVDINPEVVEMARENVERAGLRDLVQIENADFFSWEKIPDARGTVLMNPPYDERLSVDNVADLYGRIGNRLKQRYGGWTAFLLAGNLEAAKFIGLRSSQRILLYNGPIECRLLKFELRAEAPQTPGHSRRKSPEENPKWKERAAVFGNRLQKNLKHYSKWARREGVSCWRVYDWDIPELPYIVDMYGDHLHVVEIPRNYDHSPLEHVQYNQYMLTTAASALNVATEKAYFQTRTPQESVPKADFIQASEGPYKFLVNLNEPFDTGLVLDQRILRSLIKKEASGKDFLSLFGYTGTSTVYAAAGNAKSTVTVDTTSGNLEVAEKNLHLNGLSGSRNKFFRSDILEFLEKERTSFDLCLVDLPARLAQSNAIPFLRLVLNRMRPGGKVFLSTSYREFGFNEATLKERRSVAVKEITSQTIPLDFERKPSHRCWLFEIN